MFVGVRKNQTLEDKQNMCIVHHKYRTQLGEMKIFEPGLKNYQFSQPRKIILIYVNTMYVFSMYHPVCYKVASGVTYISFTRRQSFRLTPMTNFCRQ